MSIKLKFFVNKRECAREYEPIISLLYYIHIILFAWSRIKHQSQEINLQKKVKYQLRKKFLSIDRWSIHINRCSIHIVKESNIYHIIKKSKLLATYHTLDIYFTPSSMIFFPSYIRLIGSIFYTTLLNMYT